ncbi:MAG: hypothetical protein OEX02_03165, partial [Cyclobacteriaceae bacterium]|nr:hypothetical protein [Cyclobacteriaceae bacterium]
MRYRLLLMAFITGLTSYIGKAQNYPISANLMMMPPYSVYLTDYSSHTVPRMQVNLLLKDLRASNVKVRFRATIKGPGIVISTKENYYGTPVYLDGGAPLNLSQSDFFDYFLPENMDFNGISRREIDRTGRLPEGIYQFSFEVLDYNRGTIISNKALAFAWLILNDPPLINYPRDGEKLKPALPQQIMFNWAPRHAGSPNSAFITQYKFELIEVWPAERNPNEAFDVLSPLFVTSTPATSLVYGPTDPLLEPGRTYAVRVQAIPEQNHSSLELFKNKGYSEVISFKYGDPCLVPDNIRISANSHNKIVLEWDSRPVFSAYHVKYQPAGAEEWYELNPIINKTQLDALQPETTYHYTLAGECGPFMSDYSPEGTIRMDKEPASLVNCAAPMPAIDISTMEILTHLSPGAYVTAGDFVVQVTEAYPSGNQSFSGKGIIKVPFFKNARANVLFSNIKVSNTYQLISGGVKVIGGKLVLPEKIRTISDSLDQLLTMADEMLNEAARVYDTLQEVLQIPEDKAPDAGEAQRAETAKSDSTSLDGNITKADSTFLEESTTKTDTLLADTNSPNDSLNSDNNTNNPDSGTTATGESSTIASKTTGEEETASFSTNSALSREMQFGPLRVHFPEVPVSAEKNENGLCRFAELLAEVELMINTGFYTEKFTLPTTDFSFLQYCDSAHFTDVSFSWEGKKTLSPLNWLKISLIKAEISLSPEGRINGSLQIKPDLEGLIEISSMAALRGLDAGTITYYFDNTQGFSGRFDFSQLTDLEVIIQKGQEVLYDMSGVSFDADGNIELEVENNTGAEWATDMLITRITSLGINARLSVWEGFSLINGNINMELEGLPGFSGPLKFSTAVSNGLMESTIHSENIQAFGMALSVPQLTVILDKNLDVRQISGHMGVQHPDFDSQLEINDFTIADSRLTSFSGSGKINYEGLNINILSSEYLEKENVLSLNALVEIAHNGNYVSATLSKFTISPDGTITLGDYSYAGSLTQDFGPVKVVFSTQPSPTGKEGRYKVYQDVEATVFLKMNEGEKKQEKEITKVMLTYKQTSKGAWKEFEAHWKGTGIPLGNINHLDTKITGIDISMEDDKNTKITGSVNCAAKLTNDLKLSEIHEGFKSSTGFDVIIKKGAETNASFSFS